MIHRETPTTLNGGTIQTLGETLKNQSLPTHLLPQSSRVKLSEQTVNSTEAMKNDIETMKASISELGVKLNQLATYVLKIEGKGKLPAQSNHANVSTITLRSDKNLNKNDDVSLSQNDHNLENVDSNAKEEKEVQTNSSFSNASSSNNDSKNIVDNPLPPFPSRLSQPRKKFKNDEELLEAFKKVEVNLSLLMAIKSIPRDLLSVEFDDDVVSFNIFYDVKSSNDHVSLCALDTLESLEKLEEHDNFNELIDQATLEYVENEFAKNKPSDDDLSIFLIFVASVNDEHVFVDNIATNEQHALDNDFTSSNEHDLGRNIKDDNGHIVKKLKVLPSHLKYAFLREKNTYPVIILKELTKEQEARLFETLKRYRQATGWSLEDLKGIDPSFCTLRIHLEEGAKNKIQLQRRLNPTLKEVVKKEVLKLKDVGIIYLVPHSTWVSSIHVVPKKFDVTIVENG
ncbi:Transposon Ty3-I Gag-Pol polyprotein [Cucumis melo var. makuwa]|uniref:Transposon Ty3-I Gag-Pol polyprotein n=1 Tax=Cucumis melo var. makuwa TaxID=1194695 RepID=A0A5D3BDS0_CUCMM|nr:Transposon Ty3-I Gag-Pol polyprotein [Cucumis melo var. makuwa]TYJ96801.1 Transposon Ty3-I Gag-Pol polyprotein [Cucumis melo var. makuwa]